MDHFKPGVENLSKRARRARVREEYQRQCRAAAGQYPAVVNDIPIGVTNAQDTTRAPSPAVWKDISWSKMIADPARHGIAIFDDFDRLPYSLTTNAESNFGQWDAWIGSSQTIGDGIEEGGVAKLDGGSANKSTTLSTRTGCFRFVGASTGYTLVGKKFAMEFRIALGSVSASQQGVFIGVADHTSSAISSSDTTIQASGGNTLTTTKNIFGFFNRTTTGPADWSVVYQPAAGTAVYPTGLTTLVNTVTGSNMSAYAASTDKGKGTGFVKIGMRFDPTGSAQFTAAPATCPSGQTAGTVYRPTVTFYVNGVQAPAFLHPGILQAATFPLTSVYSPVINYMNIAGGAAPIYLDWVRFGQGASF